MTVTVCNNNQLKIILFLFFLVLNFSTTGGHIMSSDEVTHFMMIENFVLNQSLKVDLNLPILKEMDGTEIAIQYMERNLQWREIAWKEGDPYISYYAPMAPFLAISASSFYLLGTVISDPIHAVSFFHNSLVLSITAFLVFLTANRFFNSNKISVLLSIIFIVTTFVWPYNTGLFPRPLASLFIILSIYLIYSTSINSKYRPLLASLSIGMALISHQSSLILIPGLFGFGVFYYLKNKKFLFLFIVGVLIFAVLQGILNEIRFDNFLNFGIPSSFGRDSNDMLGGIYGYVFSLGWGLPFHAPLILIIPIALFHIFRHENRNMKLFGILIIYLTLVTWLFYGTLQGFLWSGYGTWGPRYFISILPLLILPIGFLIKKYQNNIKFKIVFISLAIWGFLVNFLGKLVWYIYGYSYGWEIMKIHLLENGWNLHNYDINYIPITMHISVLTSSYIQKSGGFNDIPQKWGLAPCVFDLYIFCKLGILPFGIILTALVILGILLCYFLYFKNTIITFKN